MKIHVPCQKCGSKAVVDIDIADDTEAQFQYLKAVSQRSSRIVETRLFSIPVDSEVKPGCKCFKETKVSHIELGVDFFRRKK